MHLATEHGVTIGEKRTCARGIERILMSIHSSREVVLRNACGPQASMGSPRAPSPVEPWVRHSCQPHGVATGWDWLSTWKEYTLVNPTEPTVPEGTKRVPAGRGLRLGSQREFAGAVYTLLSVHGQGEVRDGPEDAGPAVPQSSPWVKVSRSTGIMTWELLCRWLDDYVPVDPLPEDPLLIRLDLLEDRDE